MSRKFPAGVATGSLVKEIIQDAKENSYALPACNVIGSSSINAAMEAAVEVNSPIIIQFSNGGAAFNAGKGLKSDNKFVPSIKRSEERRVGKRVDLRGGGIAMAYTRL